MIDMFGPWIAMQQEVLNARKRQVEVVNRALGAGQDMIAAQQAAQDAARANIKAANSWFALWGWK